MNKHAKLRSVLVLTFCLPLSVFVSSSGRSQQLIQGHQNHLSASLAAHQLPHPMNATMGIPDPVGSYNIRLNGFRQKNNGGAEYDLSGHIGYGMFEWGGIHLRSLGVRTTPFTEIIGIVGFWRNDARTQGASLLGIIGLPTGKKKGEAHHGLAYLLGLTGRMARDGLLTNDIILHYDFSAKHYIAENGMVIELTPNVFGVVDARGVFGKSRPEVSLLPALKLRMLSSTYVAIGYNASLTKAKPFQNQMFVQVEIGSH
ncbi:MAG: hypothetical protein AABZ61_06310 [Bacteroidota bacterium]